MYKKKKEEKRKHQIFSKTRSFVILLFEKSTSLDIFKNKAEKAREKDHRSSFLLFAKFNDVFEREIIIELKNCSWENATTRDGKFFVYFPAGRYLVIGKH